MDSAGIQISNVSVVLGGKKVLRDVTVGLPTGKVTGCIGPSGAGKTTLIRSIVGRQHISSGHIFVAGLPAGSAILRQKISYMTQELSFYSDLTVIENLRYFATMSGLGKKERAVHISDTLQAVDLGPQAKQLAASLSGGQKQRLSLALTLLSKPAFLMLDEPTVGLDPLLREQLWQLFGHLADSGITLLVSSHVMDEAERCDELLLLREGRVLAHDSPRALCEHTHSKSVEESFLKLVKQGSHA